jgi:trimeric autotransporter adhesin
VSSHFCKLAILSPIFTVLLLVAAPEVQAQDANSEAASPETPASNSAEDLTVEPRGRIGYQTSEAGINGFGSIEGFFPLGQTPGQSLIFLQGHLRVDNSSYLGSSILLGYRKLNLTHQSLLGGYVSLDNQGSQADLLTQIGAGFERLGAWDLRGNVYVPLSDGSDWGLSGAPFFVQNQLQLPASRTVPLTSVDLEAGMPIAMLGNNPLRAYGGLYYYSGDDIDGTLGGRIRLEAQPLNFLNLGLGLQYDELFGTSFTLGINALLDGSYSNDRGIVDRANSAVRRSGGIATIRQSENFTANDPDTGIALFFIHADAANSGVNNDALDIANNSLQASGDIVAADASGGDGSYEAPFAELEDAFDAHSDAARNRSIVYVRNDGTYDEYIFVPEGVQLLSTGPVQWVDTQLGQIMLPGSDSGAYPNLLGVEMARNTTLAGFEIDGAEGDGVFVEDAFNIDIRDNFINSFGHGIHLENLDGDVTIARNTLNADGAEGIYISEIFGDAVVSVIIADNTINSNADGGEGAYAGGIYIGEIYNGAVASVTIADNTFNVNADGGEGSYLGGIYIGQIYDEAAANVTIADNTFNINADGSEGIYSTAIYVDEIFGDAVANIDIVNNTITSIDGGEGFIVDEIYGNAVTSINILNNTFDIEDDGIYINDIDENASVSAVISGNIINSGSDAIYFDYVYGDADATIIISDNTIMAEDRGINFFRYEDNAVVNVTIENNQINSLEEGIELAETEGNVNANIAILSNVISSEEEDGIYFDEVYNDSTIGIILSNNTISSQEDGIDFDDIYSESTINITLSNNTISSQENGIDFDDIYEDSTVDITLSDNIITAGADGIDWGYIGDNAEVVLTIANNTVTATEVGLSLGNSEASQVSVSLLNNTFSSTNNAGVFLYQDGTGTLCVALSGNTATPGNGSSGYELIKYTAGGEFQLVNQLQVSTQNTGSFDPSDVTTNLDFTNVSVCN